MSRAFAVPSADPYAPRMSTSPIAGFLAERSPSESLQSVAMRCARALSDELSADSCEIWMWRTAEAGERWLERIVPSGQGPSDEALQPWLSQDEWLVESLPGGGAVASIDLAGRGYARVASKHELDARSLDRVRRDAPAIGARLAETFTREEMEFGNRWLTMRNELDRRAATSLAGVRSVDELGKVIESLAERLFPIEYSGMYFLDPVSGKLRLAYAKGLSEAERERAESTAGQRHPGQVIRTGRPVDVEDTESQHDPHEPQGHGRAIRSRLYLPVRVGGVVVGTIGFASSSRSSFGRRHHEALAFFAELAGISYARLQAQLETTRRGELIEATATANERLLSVIDWRHAATAALALVGRAVGADTLALVRLEPEPDAVQVDFVWQPIFGSPWPNRDRVARLLPDEAERLSRGQALEFDFAGRGGITMLKPVVTDGELWGVVAAEFESSGLAHFGRAERAAIRGLANGFSSAITREQMDQELRERQKLDAVSRLATGIAHDFNNLLWPVLLYSDMLERTASLDDRSRQMLRDMRLSAQRASELVQQVFAISRHRERVLQVIDVAALAAEVAARTRRSLGESGRLETDIDADAGHVLGDEGSLRELLVQLLSQTLEPASERAGRAVSMRVRLARVERDRGSWISVEITDDAPSTRASHVQVATIGRLVAELGGELHTVPAGPGGSRRTLLLPIALREPHMPGAVIETAAAGAPAKVPAPTAEHILLVDDDASVLEVARQILESLGYAVTACLEPAKALALIGDSSRPFALLLTDLAMPGMDGLTLAREAKRLRPALAIVCCTGFGDSRAERTASEIGVAAFIRKPINFDHYAKTIRAAIERSQRGS